MKSVSKDDLHDFGPTEKELAALLTYIDRLARSRAFLDGGMTPLEEYIDHGITALVYAWQAWDSTRGIPFYALARHVIWLRLHQTPSKYHVCALPGGRSLPDADMIGRVVAQDTNEDDGTGGTRELICDPPESLAWFYRDLARHWTCMSPRMQQTLQDCLEDVPRATIMARDQVRREALEVRGRALVAFLKRHVVDRETSCMEEQAGWKKTHGQPLVDPAEATARQRARMAQWRKANKAKIQAYNRAYRRPAHRPTDLAAAD